MVFIAGRTAEVGDIKGLTGDTAMESGTGDEEIGVDPVGVVLPLLGCNKEQEYFLIMVPGRAPFPYSLIHTNLCTSSDLLCMREHVRLEVG